MAKLNGVKTLDMVAGEITKVQYGGDVYAKVDDVMCATQVTDGDIGLTGTEHDSNEISPKSFYRMRKKSQADKWLGFASDNEGDRNGLHYKHITVFRKASAAPTTEQRVTYLEKRVGKLEGDAPAPLKAGDYAKVVGDKSYIETLAKGDVVEIRESANVYDFRCYRVTDGMNELFFRGDLVRATDEEVAAAKAEATKLEEEARWAKIGRKPGEFKEGDIAKVTGRMLGKQYYGEIDADSCEGRRIKFRKFGYDTISSEYPDTVELITPVEARFDRA